jgi:hypothetical protein
MLASPSPHAPFSGIQTHPGKRRFGVSDVARRLAASIVAKLHLRQFGLHIDPDPAFTEISLVLH